VHLDLLQLSDEVLADLSETEALKGVANHEIERSLERLHNVGLRSKMAAQGNKALYLIEDPLVDALRVVERIQEGLLASVDRLSGQVHLLLGVVRNIAIVNILDAQRITRRCREVEGGEGGKP